MRIKHALSGLAIGMLACTVAQAGDITHDELADILRKNPDVLIDAIRTSRKAIFNIINETGVEEQTRMRKEADEAAQKAYEDTFQILSSRRSTARPVSAAQSTPNTLWSSMRTFNAHTARRATRPSMN